MVDLSGPRLGGLLLIAGFALFVVGGVMFTARGGMRGASPSSFSYLAWERGSLIAAALITAFGLVLLAGVLEGAGDAGLGRLGAITVLSGALMVTVAETTALRSEISTYPLIVVSVVLVYLGQAVFGLGLVSADLLAPWVGWATVFWALGWLVALVAFSPSDVFFPVLHHVMPLVIGIGFLASG